MQQVSQHDVAMAKKSFGIVSPLYRMGHMSGYKNELTPRSEIKVTRYKVYDSCGRVVKSTNDIKVARNAERYYKGFIKVF
jgi:hypothetical protein